MNIAVIERMISQADMSLDALRYLVSCRLEIEWLDFKQELHLEADAAACAFTRDVLGMKNVGGGYIVVGAQDKTWRAIGISAPLPYDGKLLRDIVRKCCGLELDVDIVHHNAFADAGTGRFALILVRGCSRRKKRRAPSVVSKDGSVAESVGKRAVEKAAPWKSPKAGLSHSAWKSRKGGRIPTFATAPATTG